jgi:hypothetical protein
MIRTIQNIFSIFSPAVDIFEVEVTLWVPQSKSQHFASISFFAFLEAAVHFSLLETLPCPLKSPTGDLRWSLCCRPKFSNAEKCKNHVPT